MHQLIRVVVAAEDASDATRRAQSALGPHGGLSNYYDYGKLMNENRARWKEGMPDEITESGAILADSDDGMTLITGAWESTMSEMKRDLAAIRKGIEMFDDEEIMGSAIVEDIEVEPWNPMGLASNEDEYATTYTTDVRYAMYCFGSYGGPSYYLYNEYGEATRSPEEYERLLEKIENEETPEDDEKWYVVPVDVHY